MSRVPDSPQPAASDNSSAPVPSPVLVVGLGNPLLGDDGVGWHIARRVGELIAAGSLQTHVEIDCLSVGGLSLMERLVGYRRAIIVDALTTGQGPPGSVYHFSLEALPDLAKGHLTSAHDTTLPTALKAGRALGLCLPAEIMIVGVETQPNFDFTETLSTVITAAVQPASQVVLQLLYQFFEEEHTHDIP